MISDQAINVYSDLTSLLAEDDGAPCLDVLKTTAMTLHCEDLKVTLHGNSVAQSIEMVRLFSKSGSKEARKFFTRFV